MKTVAAEGGVTFHQALRLRQFWTVVFAYAVALFCTYSLQIHIAPSRYRLGELDYPGCRNVIDYRVFSVIARFTMGGIGDRIGNVKAMMICYAILVVTTLSLGLLKQSWALYIILPYTV